MYTRSPKDILKYWFKVYQEEFNIFEVGSLCKRNKITLCASDTNHSSCIVKLQGIKYHLSTFENTCERIY